MSLLNKLTVQGIRSFGLDTEDIQKIEFSPPVTLIVGENGCGKTTIIECLKYALTGEVPPGSERGKHFIHESAVRANRDVHLGKVRLTVTDSNLVDKTVTRALKLEKQKGKKPKFETLNSTITFVHPNGQREDISGRVEDINNYMSATMGVSKAILNNVIFCHQEDSNWPLDEGKKLKEKFDAIFGTVEYNKTIDKIIKLRKDIQQEHKEITQQIVYFEEIKDQVEKKENKIRADTAKCQEYEQKLECYDESMGPMDEQLKKLLEKEKIYGKLWAEKLNCKNMLTNKYSECENLREKVSKNGKVERDLEKLTNQQMNFESDRKEKQVRMQSLLKECTDLKAEADKKNQTVMSLKGQIHNHTSDYQQLQERLAERFDKVRDICTMLEIPFTDDPDQSVNTQVMSETLGRIKKFIMDANADLLKMKTTMKEEDNQYQKKIDKMRDDRTKLETNVDGYHKSIQSVKRNIEETREEISKAEKSIPMLKKIQPQLEAAEAELKTLIAKNKTEDVEDQLSVLQVDIAELEDEQVKMDDTIEKLHSASRYTNELESKESELGKNQSDYNRLKNKSSSNFKALFVAKKMTDSNFKSQVQMRQQELKKEIDGIDSQLSKNRLDNQRMQLQRENLRKDEVRKDREIKGIERKIQDLCGNQDYTSVLESQKEKVSKKNMELAVLESSVNTYNDYIEKINEVPCCPLCNKDLELDADQLIDDLKEKIDELPRKIEETRRQLQAEARKFDRLNEMKSSYESLQRLKSEQTQTEQKLEQLDDDFAKSVEERENLELNLSEPKALFEMITPHVIAEMIKLDDLQRAISTKTKEIDEIKKKMPQNIPKTITLSEAMAKRKEITERVKTLNANKKALEDQVSEYKNKLMSVREKINELQKQKNEYQARVQGIDKSKEQVQKYKEERSALEKQLDSAERQIEPIKRELDTLARKKAERHAESANRIEEKQATLNKLQVDSDKVEDLNRQIDQLASLNLEDKIDQASRKIKSEQDRVKAIESELETKKKEEQTIRDTLSRGDVVLYNIIDNISLIKLEKECKDLNEKYKNMKKSIGDMDNEKIVKEKEEILKKMEELRSERYQIIGSRDSLKKMIAENEKELKKDSKYTEARKKYSEAMVQEFILKQTVEDLNVFRTTLERSLLQYHQEKMSKINKTVKQLWNDIYRGNDIDYIEVKAEEEGVSSTDKKRSYNYRVCQRKLGGDLTEMRGRCSAGQKVLASLIIRIALADTFSGKCGILALDEPTTNLDQVNIKSLSEALSRLVQQRDDGHFMLIVITHDESFVSTLKADKYFRVSRSHEGLSVIDEVRY